MKGLVQLNINLKKIRIGFFTLLIILLIITEVALSQIPLTKIFSYEYTAINSIILFLFGGLVTLSYSGYISEPVILLKEIVPRILILLLISFVGGLITNIIFTNCPLSDGILFFIVITIPSAYFGSVTAYLTKVFIRKYYYLLFTILFFALLSYPLLEFYFNPQIYFFNSVFGYFPGTIYDEDINVDLQLVAYRIYNIVVYSSLLFLVNWSIKKKNIGKLITVSAVIIIALLAAFCKPYLGFATTHSRLKNNLTNTLTTKNFIIHYPNNIKDSSAVSFMGLLHQYYYEKISNELGLKDNDKIDSYVFDNEIQKRDLFGAGKADVSKPWLRQIYLNYPTYHETLKHEIIHVLAGDFGTTPFKVAHNLNPAIIEGIAVAIENKYDIYSVDYIAKLAKSSGIDIPIEKLFEGLNFFGSSSAFSYIKSGSFFRFLIQRYGIEKVKLYYGNGNPQFSFGIVYNSLQKEYDKYMDDVRVIENKNTAQLYFSGMPVFKKYCPRSAASETKRAWRIFNDKEYESSKKLFQKIYSYSNSYSSLIGYINSLTKLNELGEAEDLLEDEIKNFSNSPYIYNLELMLGDLKVRNHKIDEARILYDTLLSQNAHIEYNNQVYIRRVISNDEKLLIKFLEGGRGDRLNILISMNEAKNNYHTIPTLLNLCASENLDEILQRFTSINDADDIYSSFALYELSKKFLFANDYYNAKKLIIHAMGYKEDNYLEFALKEQLELTNWFINFSEEEISHFKINE